MCWRKRCPCFACESWWLLFFCQPVHCACVKMTSHVGKHETSYTNIFRPISEKSIVRPHTANVPIPSSRERTYVPRYLCSPVPMFPESMFPGAYVPRYLCSPVPMFPGFCTLIMVIRINRLQISINRLQIPPVR